VPARRTGSASTGATCSVPPCCTRGSDEQKARFLPRIMRCEDMWGQGFSEPEAGSDLGGVRTRALRDGSEWVLNGQKIWMTFGTRADWLYVLCRTDPDAPKHRGLSLILVPADQPGVDIRPIRNLADGAEFAEVFFSDARTAADLVVGPIDGAWSVVMGTVGTERGTTVLPYQAAFEHQLHDLVGALRARGRTADPVVRQRLARAWIGLEINRYNNARMLTRLVRDGTLGPEASLSKLFWSQWHRDLGESMMDLLGADTTIVGDGYALYPFQSVFLDSRAETIYGGANEIQRNIVAERVLGLPKEPRP
jgi:alkylation response protein AidB-like acyl-CoA dehydrogenase